MIDQIGIAICGVSATYLSQDKRESWRKWACICGLCGQPFWFYATLMAEQWGILALVFVYTLAWAQGLRTYWIKTRLFAESKGFEVPPHRRAWGGVLVSAARAGIVRKVGHRSVTNPKAHCAVATLWRAI